MMATLNDWLTQQPMDEHETALYSYDDYDEPPDIDDSVRFCPECETPNQFGELCGRCRREAYMRASIDTYKLIVTEWDGEDEYGDGGKPVVRDRYFGLLDEVVSRLCWPWLSGFNHAIYKRQGDGSWLLYYHSI